MSRTFLSMYEPGAADGDDAEDFVEPGVPQLPIRDLLFNDLKLRVDQVDQIRPRDTLYKIPEEGRRSKYAEIPEDFEEAVVLMVRMLNAFEKKAGSFVYDGIQYRYQKMLAARDQTWCNVRRFFTRTLTIDDLRIHPDAVAAMKAWNRKSGLILIGGGMSNGKSTTIAHLLKYFLESSGGSAVTIEDPIEFPLQGNHGEYGHCIQTEARRGQWATQIEDTMRMAADYIMLGEIRSPETALLALQAASSGHVILATIHAGGVDEVVTRFCSYAAGAFESGGDEHVRREFGACLIGVAHQVLSGYGPDLTLLYGDNDDMRRKIAQVIEDRHDVALKSGGWSRVFRSDRSGPARRGR